MTVFSEAGVLVATGNVKITYRDILVTGDYAEYDENLQYLLATGNIMLEREDEKKKKQKVNGQALKFEFEQEEGAVYNVDGFSDPFYFDGKEIVTESKKSKIGSSDATTCDLPEPHYRLKSKKTEVFHEDKVVARKLSLWVGKKRILNYPKYQYSLREKRKQGFAPDIGHNKTDGFYMTAQYNYFMDVKNYGTVSMKMTQKRGTGESMEHTFVLPGDGKATLLLSYMPPSNPLQTPFEAKSTYTQTLDTNLKANGNLSYINTPTTTSYIRSVENLTSSFSLAKNTVSSSWTLNNTYNLYGGLTVQQDYRAGVNFNQNFKDNLFASLNLDYFNSQRTLTPANQELNSKIELKKKINRVDVSFLIQRRNDPDGSRFTGDNSFSAVNRLPEVTVSVSPLVLNKKNLPVRVGVTHGKYVEFPVVVKQERQDFFASYYPSLRLTQNALLNFSTDFHQYFYQNGFAQFKVGTTSQLTLKHAPGLTTSLAHSFQKAKGFTPFFFDKLGGVRLNNMTGSLEYAWEGKYLLRTSTGYNFNAIQNPWSQLNTSFQGKFSPSVSFGFTHEFNPNDGRSRNLNTNLGIKVSSWFEYKNSFFHDLGAGRSLRVDHDIKATYKNYWTARYATSYSLISHAFLFQDFYLERDMHCWMAKGVYRGVARSAEFQLFIKAFPTAPVAFGVNDRGFQY